MRVETIVSKRVFNIRDLSEEEGLVLRTLLNLNEEGIRKSLAGDALYWNDDMSEDVAVEIGKKLVRKVFDMVDRQ